MARSLSASWENWQSAYRRQSGEGSLPGPSGRSSGPTLTVSESRRRSTLVSLATDWMSPHYPPTCVGLGEVSEGASRQVAAGSKEEPPELVTLNRRLNRPCRPFYRRLRRLPELEAGCRTERRTVPQSVT